MALKLANRASDIEFSILACALIYSVIALVCKPAEAHHWYQESHDINTLLTLEVEVIEHRFVNPHPFFTARLINANNGAVEMYGDKSGEWQLQMDNRRELEELGFVKETLSPGDNIIVTAHPGSFRKNILYVKALEHPRLGFRYEHNVRQLFLLP